MLIYKIFRRPEWAAFRAAGTTTGAPIDVQDGYIHFSTTAQVAETAAKHFAADSDAAIVKGLVALVLLLADNRPPAAIDTGEIRARLDALGLSKHLSSNRTQGLASMIARIGELAATSAA